MASDPSEPRRRYLFALDAVLAVCVAIYLVAHSLPGQPAIHLMPFAPGAVAQVVAGVTTLALLLAPAMVLAAATWIPIWRRPTDAAGRRRRVRATIGAGVGMAVGVVLAFLFANDHGVFPSAGAGDGTGVILGNVFTQTGHSPATSNTSCLPGGLRRQPGLVQELHAECRVVVAGPTTLAAILSSLRMGFRTIAIERR